MTELTKFQKYFLKQVQKRSPLKIEMPECVSENPLIIATKEPIKGEKMFCDMFVVDEVHYVFPVIDKALKIQMIGRTKRKKPESCKKLQAIRFTEGR